MHFHCIVDNFIIPLCFTYMGKAIGHSIEPGCIEMLPKRAHHILGMSPLAVKVKLICNWQVVGYHALNLFCFHMYSWY